MYDQLEHIEFESLILYVVLKINKSLQFMILFFDFWFGWKTNLHIKYEKLINLLNNQFLSNARDSVLHKYKKTKILSESNYKN